ncbi:hypothetical protein GcM3_186044, partial [Golovinomyces cichoracearum]
GASLDINNAHNLAQSIFDEVYQNLDKIYDIPEAPLTLKQPSNMSRLYLNKADLFVKFVDQLSCGRASGSKKVITQKFKNYTIFGDQYSGVLIEDSIKIARLLPYEGILMIRDLCLARANLFDGIRVLYPNNLEMEEKVKQVLDWSESCLTTYGNEEDPIFSGDGALQRLVPILREKELTLIPNTHLFLVENLITILNECQQLSTIVQLFGLQKISVYPLINPKTRGTTAAQMASKTKSISYHSELDLLIIGVDYI